MGWRGVVVACLALWGVNADAQTLPWPMQANPQGGGQSGTQQTLCTLEMTRLNENVEALRSAARTANDRRAKREEICLYLNELAQSATRLARYAVENRSACGLTMSTVAQIKDGGQRAVGACQQICVIEPAAGRLDDVPTVFAGPIHTAGADCSTP
jgi:hypothetical protein